MICLQTVFRFVAFGLMVISLGLLGSCASNREVYNYSAPFIMICTSPFQIKGKISHSWSQKKQTSMVNFNPKGEILQIQIGTLEFLIQDI
ncbi:MAG: hypothetical protein GY707_15775 [Desulfobacteraceae bacterium]|nr:hypothetical protein [Desulfobacteraceae bacterium]